MLPGWQAPEDSSRAWTRSSTRGGGAGNRLSVGQRQLVSLSRPYLPAGNLHHDEATSSVRHAHRGLIQRGMEALMKGRTSFIIAHRLSNHRRAAG